MVANLASLWLHANGYPVRKDQSSMLALTATALYTPTEQIERPVVLIEDGAVAELRTLTDVGLPPAARHIDFGDCVLAPGFIDIHIHGSAGHDVMKDDESGRVGMEKFLARKGVSGYFPTTVAAPLDTTLRALEYMADGIESAKHNSGRAQPLGIHLEGPFLSHARRGVHLPEDLMSPSVSAFDKFWQAARGHIRLMTIAPELPGAKEVIHEASRRGVCVSLGHSDADLDATRAGIAAGARHATHTFNAMRPLNHREPGILGEVLSNPAITADMIVDGIHVHPDVVRIFLAAKGEGAVLITDAIAAAGMPDGTYMLGPLQVEVKNGKCERGGTLAGSVLTLDRAVRNVVTFAGWNLQQAVRAASLNPATVVGGLRKGRVSAGADADLVALSSDGQVRATIVRGEVIQ